MQPGVFWVQDASGNEATEQAHTVSFGDAASLPSCDCLDWQRYKLPCKHLCSVFSSFPDWGWDMLNSSYTANTLINLDYSCIKPWVDAQDKQTEKLSHYNIAPTFNLKGDDLKVTKSKSTLGSTIEKATICGSDIKISGVELEVPMVNKASGTSSSGSSSSRVDVEDVEEEGADDIAVQCRDLLTNLALLNSKLGKNDHIERLKADLVASIGMLQQSPEKLTFTEKSLKREHDEDGDDVDLNDSASKKIRVDGEKSDSDGDVSYVSEDEQVGVPLETVSDIEEETVEIITEQIIEDDILSTSTSILENNDVMTNADVPIQTILTRPQPVEELTAEQKERKLLAILTASSS